MNTSLIPMQKLFFEIFGTKNKMHCYIGFTPLCHADIGVEKA